jgi:two-component sensor histidine kinase
MLRLVTDDAPPSPEVNGGTLALEANHRIANHLAAVVGLIRLHAASVARGRPTMTTEEVRLLLMEIAGRIDTVGQLHKLLAQSNGRATIDLGEFLRQVCAIAVSSLSLSAKSALYYDCSPGCAVRSEHVVPMALVINEAVTNAVKYAHPSGVAGKIVVRCQRQPDGRDLLVEVVDDGVGLPEGFDPAVDGGLGFRLVRSLSDQLGATLAFENAPLGLHVRLLIPAQAEHAEAAWQPAPAPAMPPSESIA